MFDLKEFTVLGIPRFCTDFFRLFLMDEWKGEGDGGVFLELFLVCCGVFMVTKCSRYFLGSFGGV